MESKIKKTRKGDTLKSKKNTRLLSGKNTAKPVKTGGKTVTGKEKVTKTKKSSKQTKEYSVSSSVMRMFCKKCKAPKPEGLPKPKTEKTKTEKTKKTLDDLNGILKLMKNSKLSSFNNQTPLQRPRPDENVTYLKFKNPDDKLIIREGGEILLQNDWTGRISQKKINQGDKKDLNKMSLDGRKSSINTDRRNTGKFSMKTDQDGKKDRNFEPKVTRSLGKRLNVADEIYQDFPDMKKSESQPITPTQEAPEPLNITLLHPEESHSCALTLYGGHALVSLPRDYVQETSSDESEISPKPSVLIWEIESGFLDNPNTSETDEMDQETSGKSPSFCQRVNDLRTRSNREILDELISNFEESPEISEEITGLEEEIKVEGNDQEQGIHLEETQSEMSNRYYVDSTKKEAEPRRNVKNVMKLPQSEVQPELIELFVHDEPMSGMPTRQVKYSGIEFPPMCTHIVGDYNLSHRPDWVDTLSEYLLQIFTIQKNMT